MYQYATYSSNSSGARCPPPRRPRPEVRRTPAAFPGRQTRGPGHAALRDHHNKLWEDGSICVKTAQQHAQDSKRSTLRAWRLFQAGNAEPQEQCCAIVPGVDHKVGQSEPHRSRWASAGNVRGALCRGGPWLGRHPCCGQQEGWLSPRRLVLVLRSESRCLRPATPSHAACATAQCARARGPR